MVAYQVADEIQRSGRTLELIFAGDGVRLAGQIDYPEIPPPAGGFPIIYIIQHAGCNTREDYEHFARIGLSAGYAVFRWDRRGTGRSGAGGRGSTTQDALRSYEAALQQPNINRGHAVVLAVGAGTCLLGKAFGLFARIERPVGAILVANMLDENEILAVDTRVQIVVGQNDWNPWSKYGRAACDAHAKACEHGSSYYVAPEADRMICDGRAASPSFHAGAREVMLDWLTKLNLASASR